MSQRERAAHFRRLHENRPLVLPNAWDPELGRLGVARVSLGPAVALAALATTQRAARELLEQGTYSTLEQSLPFGDVNSLFSRVPR